MAFPEIVKFAKNFDNITVLKPKINFAQVIEQYGYPVISKEVAHYIYRMKNCDGCMHAYENGIHLKVCAMVTGKLLNRSLTKSAFKTQQ